jgi:hypothetical protein
LVEQLICNQKVTGSIPVAGTNRSVGYCVSIVSINMLKTVLMIVSMGLAANTMAQSTAPLSLEVAQQRARFARDQMGDAESKLRAADKKDQIARKRLDEAKAKADQAAKALQDAQAAFESARERHDRAYQDLKRAHDAMQGTNKPQQ